MKAINEHFEVGQQYYALVSKEVLVVSEVLQPGMYPSGSGGYHTCLLYTSPSPRDA